MATAGCEVTVATESGVAPARGYGAGSGPDGVTTCRAVPPVWARSRSVAGPSTTIYIAGAPNSDKLSNSAKADFEAKVVLSTREESDKLSTRVLLGDDQLVFVRDEAKSVVRLSDIFDVAQDVPPGASPETTATVTIGYKNGESREAATIEAPAKKLRKFQIVLFKLLLSGTTVALRRTVDGKGDLTQTDRASLTPGAAAIQFEYDGTTLSVPRNSIDRFETTKTGFQGATDQPMAIIYSSRDGVAARTSVCLPSFRHMNIFGRFLQSSPVGSTETSGQSMPSTIDVLLVDDDPRDLEMTETFLQQREDRLTVTTATSAPGGIEMLQSDSIDCVVSDYDMPGTDGIEFLKQVRTEYPELPFILFTGQGSEEIAKQALLSDVNDYVEKGIGKKQYDILAERIRKALR